MSTQKHPNTEPGGTELGALAKNAANTAASPSANAAANTAEAECMRKERAEHHAAGKETCAAQETAETAGTLLLLRCRRGGTWACGRCTWRFF